MNKSIKYDDSDFRSYRAKRKKERRQKQLGLVFLFLLLMVAAVVFGIKTTKHPVITIKANNNEVVLGEELPQPTAQVTGDQITDKKLKKTGNDKYNVQQLFEDLKAGKGYTLEEVATTKSTEGKYPIKIKLEEELKKALDKTWKRKVKVNLVEGNTTIKNPIGKWQGDKFQRYDGSFVENDFVTYKNKQYYFDENGKKVTGATAINGANYYFNKNGQMEVGWKKFADKKHYYTDNGQGAVGLLELEGDTYHFEQDSSMTTGELRLGALLYKFDKNGKMVSSKVEGIDPEKPMIAITFDDGPGPRTGEILDVLEKYGSRATFFMLGQKVSGNEAVVKRMKELGNELGNHSFDHPQLTKLSVPEIQAQINNTNQLIANASGGSGATVVRPPYGAVNDTVKATIPYPLIMWNVDTLDWKTRNVQATIDSVMSTAADGNIVLLHDIHDASVDAAKAFIPKLIEQGYQLVTVSELATAKNINMQNGEHYSSF
ncbi:MAG TPA: polysaccharide deacetylase family protein [Candidatus Dorea intestinavium]|nr:polysaccharide deacetylase family protein [Candidatus Dorea intestinavium]